MTRFCEGCPLAGDVQGETVEVEFRQLKQIIMRSLFKTHYGDNQHVGIVWDEDGNPSRPFHQVDWVNGKILTEGEVLERIDNCESVEQVTEKRFLRKPRAKSNCPALSRFAVARHSELYSYVSDLVVLENR